MIVADSNTIITCIKSSMPLPNQLIVPDDLHAEYLVAEVRHNTKIDGMLPVSKLKGYDEAYYLREYARFLNAYSHVSFVKMSGLGDVAILAITSCLVTDFGRKIQQVSLDLGDTLTEKLTVITDDRHLRKTLQSAFATQIKLLKYAEMPKP